MPMTKIYLHPGSTLEHRTAVSQAIHESLVEILGIPADDLYHVFHEIPDGYLFSAPVAFGLQRRTQAVFIQFYFGPRPADLLKQLFADLVRRLGEQAGLETRDIYLNVVPSPTENWWADGRAVDPNTGYDVRIAADRVPDRVVNDDQLGGRLGLLRPEELTAHQTEVSESLTRLVVPEGEAGGFVARLDDGRLIGPFNAMLRTPALTTALGRWVAGIAATGIDPQTREVVILTVGSAWRAEYELYAHERAAASTGLPTTAIAALASDTPPGGLSADVELAHRLTRAVVRDREVPDELYRHCVERYEVDGTIALLHLIAQYQLISSILVTFDVPAP